MNRHKETIINDAVKNLQSFECLLPSKERQRYNILLHKVIVSNKHDQKIISHLNNALKENKEQYESLINNIDVGITLIDDNYRILMVLRNRMSSAGSPCASSTRQPSHPTLPGLGDFFPPPLEFNNSSETLTEKLDRILEDHPKDQFNSLTLDQKRTIWDWEENNGLGVGACLNIFPSGEITAGCYSRCRRYAPGRRGKAVSREFTRQARKTIRRAVENALVDFIRFLTLTFDPKIAKLDEEGRVDQQWAKDELMRFLNTIKKKYDRMADTTGKEQWRISYIWVAEVQQNGNIHFHMLINRHLDVKWLVKVWGQASNSVNIKKLNNKTHAVNYMLKYMEKDNSPIKGRRYGMTQDLIEASQPIRIDLYGRAKRKAFIQVKDELAWEITQNGGNVLDWGISLPSPRREQTYKGRDGIVRTLKGTSRRIGQKLQERIQEALKQIDVVDEIFSRDDAAPDDVPF